MRKNMGAKPLTYPQPVFILAAYGDDMTPCAMNAAWGGISDDTEISLCISAGHKTTKNILARNAYVCGASFDVYGNIRGLYPEVANACLFVFKYKLSVYLLD